VDSAGLAARSRDIVAAALQVEDDLYIGPQIAAEVEESLMYLNHSCDPNIGVRGQITFVAQSDVPSGCELTIDYAMIDANPSTTMRCSCGAPQCRGLITGDDWRSPTLQRRYAGFFSSYIEARIATLRASGKAFSDDLDYCEAPLSCTFSTRQLFMSATTSVSGDGQASA